MKRANREESFLGERGIQPVESALKNVRKNRLIRDRWMSAKLFSRRAQRPKRRDVEHGIPTFMRPGVRLSHA